MTSRIEKDAVRVAVLTAWSRIEGLHHVVPGVRVSDSVNSDIAMRTRYLPLTDARVCHLETGRVIFRSRFLMVSHAHIVCMAPTSEVQPSTDASASDPLSAEHAHTLAADMQSLLKA